MKAFLKSHRGLLAALVLCAAVITYAGVELSATPQNFQRVFLPSEQTSTGTDEAGQQEPKTNHYLRELIDKAQTVTSALDGSCDPVSLYAVAQPATIGMKKENQSVSARLVGIDNQYLSLEEFGLLSGRYFYPDEYLYGDKVALIDEQLAVALFQYAEPILEELTIGDETYRIIGIVRDQKRVGDEMEYSAYVPYRSLMASSVKMTAVVYEAAPVKGSGGWAAFQNAVATLGEVGTTVSLPKETMNGLLPLRLLGVLTGAIVAMYLISVLNHAFRWLVRRYKERLRDEYAVKLLGWVVLRGLGLAVGYGVCAFALAQLFVVLIAPVFTFPEWVPAILVEPKDIVAAFWNVWQKPAAVIELRMPELLRIRFYARLMGWACGFAALFLSALWIYIRVQFNGLLPENIRNEED
ncbi:MAG: ABC transporter permease [Eubacteriales bacterium]|nr:ABC transporter permease [Eubacteriales bacterium]